MQFGVTEDTDTLHIGESGRTQYRAAIDGLRFESESEAVTLAGQMAHLLDIPVPGVSYQKAENPNERGTFCQLEYTISLHCDIVATLVHEIAHAVDMGRNGYCDGHGRQFKDTLRDSYKVFNWISGLGLEIE